VNNSKKINKTSVSEKKKQEIQEKTENFNEKNIKNSVTPKKTEVLNNFSNKKDNSRKIVSEQKIQEKSENFNENFNRNLNTPKIPKEKNENKGVLRGFLLYSKGLENQKIRFSYLSFFLP